MFPVALFFYITFFSNHLSTLISLPLVELRTCATMCKVSLSPGKRRSRLIELMEWSHVHSSVLDTLHLSISQGDIIDKSGFPLRIYNRLEPETSPLWLSMSGKTLASRSVGYTSYLECWGSLVWAQLAPPLFSRLLTPVWPSHCHRGRP